MKKTIICVVTCLALLMASAQISTVQSQALVPEEDIVDQFPEMIEERANFEPPEYYFEDDMPEGWLQRHFEESEKREFIPPTEESLRLTSQQVQAFDCGTVTDVPRVECEALVALYESTNGAGWTDNTNWLQSTTVGNWKGITVTWGRVDDINLWNNNLTGTIPATLSDLSNLAFLYLAYNQLTGTIPAVLGNMLSLQHLDISYNHLTGTIPTWLGNLRYLWHLDISGNQLTGTIPTELSNLANLKSLNLTGNQLTGTIPTWLGNLSNLQTLCLNRNHFSGTIPTELSNLAKLKNLNLTDNQLTGTIPTWLGNLTYLQSLYLDNNYFTGTLPLELGNLPNLWELNLAYNQLTGTIPASLGNLTNLEYLDLSGNQLTDTIPVELSNLMYLQRLGLSHNQLTGTIPAALGNLVYLKYLSLSSNQLTGTIPTQLGNIPNLRGLGLYSNQLTGTIPIELGNLTNLEYLDLGANQLTGTIPTELGNMMNLVLLDISYNQLTDMIPVELGNLTELIHLDISHNLLEGDVPVSFTNLTNLCIDGQPEERCYNFYSTDLGYNLLNVPQPNPPSDFLYEKDPDWDQTQGVKGVFPEATGGILVSNDDRTTVTVPTGAVDEDLTLILKPIPPASGFTPPFLSASNNFELLAFDANGEVTQFNQPLEFTLKYSDLEIGSMPEESLALHYYDINSKQWLDAITTCPSGNYTRNPDQNQFSLPVCHLTNFAVVGEGFGIYLPTIFKQ